MSGTVHFPAEAKLGQVRAFLKTVHDLGDRTQVAKVARELHMDLVMLLPVMDAAEMLQLATIERGDVKLLKPGEQLLRTGNPDFSQVRPLLRDIEPFKTALSLGKFTSEQIAKGLAKRGVRWHHEDKINAAVVAEILIHWGITSGLLDYDGYTSRFTVKPVALGQ